VGRDRGRDVALELKGKRNVGVRGVIGKKNGSLSENGGGSEGGRKYLSTL
jgi:hypothetical protein